MRWLIVALCLLQAGCLNRPADPAREVPPSEVVEPGTEVPGTADGAADLGETSLRRLYMADLKAGWLVTEKGVLRTEDGARSWRDVTPAPAAPASVCFLDAQTGWVLVKDRESGALYRTTDGGGHWHRHPVPFGAAELDCLDGQHGWALAGRGVAAGSMAADLYHTADGGTTWRLVAQAGPDAGASEGLPFGGLKNGVRFLDLANGWVAGTTYAPGETWLYRTRDGGRTWQARELPVPPEFRSAQLDVLPPQRLGRQEAVLPVRATGEGKVTILLATHDGGSTWQPLAPVQPMEAFDFADLEHGWVTDGVSLLTTTDGGKNWSVVLPSLDGVRFRQVDFVTPNVGWALVENEAGTRLLKTEDGGATWKAP